MVAALWSRDRFFYFSSSSMLRMLSHPGVCRHGRDPTPPCAFAHRRHVCAQKYRSVRARMDVLRTWKRHAACMLCDHAGMCFVADCVRAAGCLQAMAWLLYVSPEHGYGRESACRRWGDSLSRTRRGTRRGRAGRRGALVAIMGRGRWRGRRGDREGCARMWRMDLPCPGWPRVWV